ncbi:MAG: ABC transporter ATP-binding protein [Gammaproteobacteria bacterium RBG_16_57_12]|nr:MAG: ABC transporter ATP-binding protein [Gammaproteobacteria bacterium RBG_16_57_12]
MSMLLELKNVTQTYGAQPVVQDLSLALEEGVIACLLGPSGCGKTTVLRCIAGFEDIHTGEIRLSGSIVSLPGYCLPPERRRISMVFQDYALFPHLTVAGNIRFGLDQLAPAERTRRVEELLEIVGLPGTAGRYPHELSGGQQQRVALARALAPRPRLMLLDEPFSNLDIDLRERLGIEVRELLKREGITALVVTHDQREAFAMADAIGIMHQGYIQQWGTPYDIYHRPVNRFVADFVGQGTLLPGKVLNAHQVQIELGVFEGDFSAPPGAMVDVLIRPDDIVHDDDSPCLATILHKTFRGAEILYTLALANGTRLLSSVPSHHDHPLGERLGIRVDIPHVVAFARK